MRTIETDNRIRRWTARIVDYLEYLFIFVVIVECNSLFTNTALTDMTTDMSRFFCGLAMAMAVALLILHALLDKNAVKKLKGFLPLWLLLVAYAGVFYWLNVRFVSDARRENYIRNFLVLMPLTTLLFKLKQQKGEGLDLLYKHADIVCVIAAMSLTVYLAGVLHVNAMPSDPIYSEWGGGGSLRERINLLNVSMLIKGEKWQISGLELPRNTGFFVEALMFSIPLITALSTELFLRKRRSCRHLYRALLLSMTLLTANSTIGVMLAAMVWGAKAVSQSIRAGKKWIGVVVVCASVGACVLLFLAKQDTKYEVTGITGNSIADHIEDYRAGIKAFLHRPLLGGGYNYETYIREFMDPAKVASNPGLSNSVATVLGEGGAMLGLLCMLPFLIGLLYIFRKQDRDMAFWAVGPLGLYVGIIFVYHIYLMLVIAFGYSLVEVRRVEGKGVPWRLRLANIGIDGAQDTEAEAGAEAVRRQRRRTLGWAMGLAAAGAMLVWQGVPVLRAIQVFLRTHQFSVSQSPIKAFCFNAVVLFHGACVRNALRKRIGWKRLLALLAWDAIYLLIYPRLYSDVATVLTAHHSTGGRLECAALLGVYFVGCLVALETPTTGKRLSARGVAAVCAAAVCVAGGLFADHALISRLAPVDAPLASALEELTDAATGKVYAGELPSLYHRADRNISLPATGASGYENGESVSVVYPKGQNRWELFEHGFEVAELTEDTLVYSNDADVIDGLSGRGYTFYRYYPYERFVDLADLARKNELEMTEGGALIVGGGGNSLESGPSDALQRGRYTVAYAIHVDPEALEGLPEDAAVCDLVVTGWNGRSNLALKTVTAGQLDEGGDGTFDVPFNLTVFCGNVEYRALGQAEIPAEVCAMTLRETPDYIMTIAYNGYRDPIREAYYNIDGTPFVQASGYAALERVYNVGGMVKATRYFDANGEPTLIRGGYAEVRYGYNDKRTRNYEAYYGTDGAPIRLRGGYAAIKTDYDAYGCAVGVRYYDTQGQLTMLPVGYAEIRRDFDEKKQLIRETYYDDAGERVFQTGGYSGFRREYDEDGRIAVQYYLDTEDRPVCASNGIAEIRYDRDLAGRAWRESYYGVDGEPAENTSGIAILERAYNETGAVIGEKYYDAQGNPASSTSGFAETRYVLNQLNQNISQVYYDVEGKPTTNTGGYYGIDRDYDDYGNAVEAAYTDESGGRMTGTGRYAYVEYTFDDFQNLTGERYFNRQGEAATNSSGIGEIRREYNELNQNIRETYYDAEGSPVENNGGIAEIRREYNGQNEVVREEYLNLEGGTVEARGYRAVLREYNPNHTLRSERYVDEDDRAVMIPAGYAQAVYEYDEARNRVAVTYRDADGNAVANNKGIAMIRYAYENRRAVREKYFDADQSRVVSTDGYAGIEKGYDKYGNNVTTVYLDAKDSPTPNGSGVAIIRREYDAARNCVAEYYRDGQDAPTENTSGVAEVHRTYDENRNKTSEVRLNLAGDTVE